MCITLDRLSIGASRRVRVLASAVLEACKGYDACVGGQRLQHGSATFTTVHQVKRPSVLNLLQPTPITPRSRHRWG